MSIHFPLRVAPPVSLLEMLDTPKFSDFNSAAREVLAFLQERTGFDLWMVTRTEGEDWIVLQASDCGYGVNPGDVFQWADSFCSRMVSKNGPRITPCSNQIKMYAEAPIASIIQINAYIGVPLTDKDGNLFGTLCAVDPQVQPDSIVEELPLVELLANLLSALLHSELALIEKTRDAEKAQAESLKDALTDLYNRRGWDQLLDAEEKRCQSYGLSACIIIADLDNLKLVNDSCGHKAGDHYIQQVAQVLRATVRKQDVVARIGGDEFAVLCTECFFEDGKSLLERVRNNFVSAGLEVSTGVAVRHSQHGLLAAWQLADKAMYLEKQARKS